MATNKIQITDLLREGYESTKKNANSVLVFFVGLQALIFVLTDVLDLSLLNLLMIPVVLFMQIAIFKSHKQAYTKFDINQILSLKDTALKPTLWKLFITYIIYAFLIMLLFLLLVIPGIIFMVYWYVFSYVVLDQGLTGMAALKKSKEMITGNWWKTFALFVITIILTGVVSSIVSGISAENSFIGGLLMSIVSSVISVYFGYVGVAYYFKLK